MRNLHQFLRENKIQSSSLTEQKNVLRKHLLAVRQELHKSASPENWGPRQFARALELLKIKNLQDLENKYVIACFFPIRGELNFLPFATEKWLFPRMQENAELLWFEYGDGATNYVLNKHGIKEKEEKFCFPYTQSQLPMLCFVPGLAADQNGIRLGYGGGFYDKFLREFKEKVTSVFCLPSKEFLFNQLPSDEFDEKVDLLVF